MPAGVCGGQWVRMSAEAALSDQQRVASVEHSANARHSQLSRVFSSRLRWVLTSRIAREQRAELSRRGVPSAASALHAARPRHVRSVQPATRQARGHSRTPSTSAHADQRTGGCEW